VVIGVPVDFDLVRTTQSYYRSAYVFVANRKLDVALMWGPQAAYYARKQPVALAMTPARAPAELASLPFEFSMAMGVRKRDEALQRELDAVIARRQAEFQAILLEYNVPLADTALAQQPARSAP
jgi:mxaJ protein